MSLLTHHIIDLVDGKFARTSKEDLAALMANLKQDDNKDHIVIHFHGGLVKREGAMKRAESTFLPLYSNHAYPIFVVWNSDLVTTLRSNLDEIAKEEVFKQLVRRVAQYVAGKFFESGEGERGSELELDPIMDYPKEMEALAQSLGQLEADSIASQDNATELSDRQESQAYEILHEDSVIRREAMQIANGIREASDIEQDMQTRSGNAVKGSTNTLMSAPILQEIATTSADPDERSVTTTAVIARVGVKVIVAVMKRYVNGRHHGLYATIIEEVLRALYLDNLGILTWNMIKQDTANAFEEDAEQFGGTALLQALKAYWHPNLKITLVGHSTGAIYIGNFIEAADKVLPDGAKIDVIYLAAACTIPFMYQKLPLYEKRVGHIRNFALSDNVERGYWEVPLLYNASLLYFVSGVLEEDEYDMPMVGLERHFSASGPYDRKDVKGVAAYLQGKNVWSLAPEADNAIGRRTMVTTHGAFVQQDPWTLESLNHILENGFTNE